MKRTGTADLPLHYGSVPKWLYDRMAKLGTLLTRSIVELYGSREFIRRLSDPLWFQSLGCVLGMDWHSSGITASVMGSLKKGLEPFSRELGIFICGGKGRFSRKTPEELIEISGLLGLDGSSLVRASRLSAKIDNTAIQDGFQLYLHNFILTDTGDWAVVQQGMNTSSRMARRYHWLSSNIKVFDEEPHTGIVGENIGPILNLTDRDARPTKQSIITLSHDNPDKTIAEIKLVMPSRHEVKPEDINLKRLGAVLAASYEQQPSDFCNFLLINGVGPRTLQSLVLVSEVIFGTPSRFSDPARFSFAHGGKDGHPFPVPLKTYDESIAVLEGAIRKSRIDQSDKLECLKRLYGVARKIEEELDPSADFDAVIAREKSESKMYGGRTVFE
ncbi:MAG: DUF763 domain-containing protein [Brevinematales bacterium]